MTFICHSKSLKRKIDEVPHNEISHKTQMISKRKKYNEDAVLGAERKNASKPDNLRK